MIVCSKFATTSLYVSDPIRRVFSLQYDSALAHKHPPQTKLMTKNSVEHILFGIVSLQNLWDTSQNWNGRRKRRVLITAKFLCNCLLSLSLFLLYVFFFFFTSVATASTPAGHTILGHHIFKVNSFSSFQSRLFSIHATCYTSIYNKQQCSVKHNIHLVCLFIDLGRHVSIPLESSSGPR